MQNYDVLNNYTRLFTNVDVTILPDDKDVIVDWITLNKNSSYIFMVVYNRCIKYLMWNSELTTCKVLYLKDMITNYLREVASLHWIDNSKYWWTISVMDVEPMYQLLYNTSEAFLLQLQAIANWSTITKTDFPLDAINNLLDDDIKHLKIAVTNWEIDKPKEPWITIKDINDIF